MISWAQPSWWWLLPLAAAWSIFWGARLARTYRARCARYLDMGRPYLQVPPEGLRRKLAGHVLLSLALVLVIIALLRPQGAPVPTAGTRKGINLAVLLDGSRSMLCEDVVPNRMRLAQFAMETVVTQSGGSRFALFMFGGAPTLLVPATFDPAPVILAARTISPAVVGKGGTALGPAIERAATYLERAGAQPKHLVIISDGEDGEGDPLVAAMAARTSHHVKIDTVTVGTERGGAIPRYARNEQGEFVHIDNEHRASGEEITTSAHPELMKKIAEATGGQAIHLTNVTTEREVQEWVQRALWPDAVPIDDAAIEEPRELYPWLLASAAILGVAAQVLRLRESRAGRAGAPVRRRSAILTIEKTPAAHGR